MVCITRVQDGNRIVKEIHVMIMMCQEEYLTHCLLLVKLIRP